MAKKKEIKLEEEKGVLKPEEAVKLQTHCKCGANLALTGYVENNYRRFCSPGCAS